MKFETKGLVLKQISVGEADKLIVILTEDRGIIRAFVRGAKKISSNTASSTQVFCYSQFGIYEKSDKFIVNSASPIEVFFDLHKDIERLALAQYFCELASFITPVESDARQYLRLSLNSLYLLAKNAKNINLIKAVFELKIVSLAGYMPDLVSCTECGMYDISKPIFAIAEGKIYCKTCYNKLSVNIEITNSILTAMRYILYSQDENIFNFRLGDENLKLLSKATEKYVTTVLQKNFNSLNFLHSLEV